MSSSAIAALTLPLPRGVVAEAMPLGVRVSISSGGVYLSDRRVWGVALVQFLFVFVLMAAFFGFFGALRRIPHLWPILLGVSIAGGIGQAIAARAILAKRRSMPAKLELSGDRLIIDEPGFNFRPGFLTRRARMNVVPSHMEYALADLSDVSISRSDDFSPFERALGIRLTNRLCNYHLQGRSAEQVQWVCQWLSEALQAAKFGKGALSSSRERSKPENDNTSFVYDQSGPHGGC